MRQLSLAIKALDIHGKDKGNFIVRLSDLNGQNQYTKIECKKDDNESNNNGIWTTEVDASMIQMLSNTIKLEIFDATSNKDGSITETLLGITNTDFTHFLYGETEITATNTVKNAENGDIGTVTLYSTVSIPLFTDKQIDFNNYLKVEINEMKNVPKIWMDHLSSNLVTDKKKAKGKQQQTLKHWLQCEWQLFTKDLPSCEINIIQNDSPKLIISEKQDDENTYSLNWNFKSTYLWTQSDMNVLINTLKDDSNTLTNSTLKIIHKYQEKDENQEIVIVQDPHYMYGNIDITSLFDGSEAIESVGLIFGDDTDQDTTTIDVKLYFDTTFKEYCHVLNSNTAFADIITKKHNENGNEHIINGSSDLSIAKCVDDTVEILVNEHTQFMAKTHIQTYDHQRMKQGFLYHLNSTGIYHEIKDKLVKPQVLKYMKQMVKNDTDHPISAVFQNVLDSMMQNLSKNINTWTSTETITNDTTNDNEISIQKHIQIAKDFELQNMISNACEHCQTAFDRSKSCDIIIHWNATENLIKLLIKQSKISDAISILIQFLSNQQNHNQCLLTLTAILVENKHENTKSVLYELCDRQEFNITSLILKTAYFSMNNDEIRSNIHFKKAMKLSNDTKQLQEPFTLLFELKCIHIISIILDKFQRFDQIDIHFHIHQAQLHREMQRFGTAYASINDAIQINDEQSELWAIKGHIEYESNKSEKAKQSYIKHLQLLPGTAESLLPPNPDININQMIDPLALYRLAIMYQHNNEYKRSLQAFFQATEYNPESWLFWNGAGDALFHLNNYTECIHCFEQSNMIHNHNQHSWCILALCYLSLNEPKTAIKMMKEALKLDTNHTSNHDKKHIYNFGETLIQMGHIQSGTYFKHFDTL